MKSKFIDQLNTRVGWLLGRYPEMLRYGDDNCIHALGARLSDELWDKLECRYSKGKINDLIQEAIDKYRMK